MRVLVFGPFFPPAFLGGGPIRTLSALLTTLPPGVDAAICTRGADLGAPDPMDVTHDEWVRFGDSKVRYVASGSPASWLRTIAATRRFEPDVLYVNGFFDAQFAILPRMLHFLGLFGKARLVVAPRGELGAAALSLKALKKRAFLRLSKWLRMNRNVLWHASNPSEMVEIKAVMGRNSRIVVREDDTNLPLVAVEPPVREPGPLRAVHVARIVPIKRLATLLEALQGVKEPLLLDVFGPVEDARYAEQCRRAAEVLPTQITVNFAGAIEHSLVRPTLAEYDVMMLPTASENFGHIIAEALSVSCPVMCPDTTPWTPWLRQGAA